MKHGQRITIYNKTINYDIVNSKIANNLQEVKRKIVQQLQIVYKVEIQQLKLSQYEVYILEKKQYLFKMTQFISKQSLLQL
ncbi:unnamed protein product [Paramecium sonneborni]|uniref:Uncharacterized protein n=1 Tax=Paramecium sonneborni TaxID=65129 RepID=A0A8S1RWR7_9CILI|nr:unnamed protein product [Paramecium sonneborni]